MEVEKPWQTFQKADGASGRKTPHYPQMDVGSGSTMGHLYDMTEKYK
jgi:hypothetical protein